VQRVRRLDNAGARNAIVKPWVHMLCFHDVGYALHDLVVLGGIQCIMMVIGNLIRWVRVNMKMLGKPAMKVVEK
jgi:hypothetical protein